MAKKIINLGNTPNDNKGDTLRVGGGKINDNFTELYNEVILKTNSGGYTGTSQDLKNMIDALQSGFVGSIAIADNPSKDGIYIASESGTYINAGGLVVDLTTNLTFIVVESGQSNFELIEIPIIDKSLYKTVYVNNVTSLQSAFNNLTEFTKIVIDSSVTYATTQWLDIDVSNVIVNGGGVKDLISPANNSDVGGIRIGFNNPVENIVINGFGYNGNGLNQTGIVKNLDGISVYACENLIVKNCIITKTAPYHEHNTGGSGITLYGTVNKFWIFNNEIYDIGDRGMQFYGAKNGHVFNNTFKDGYDRHMTFEDYGIAGAPENIVIYSNIGDSQLEGSAIGIGRADSANITKRLYFFKNVFSNTTRNFVTIKGECTDLFFANNYGHNLGTNFAEVYDSSLNNSISRIYFYNNIAETIGGQFLWTREGTVSFEAHGNKIYNAGNKGFLIQFGTGSLCNNNIDTVNFIGIDNQSSDFVLIQNNEVKKSNTIGIFCDTTTNSKVLGNVLKDNNVNATGNDALKIAGNNAYVIGNIVTSHGLGGGKYIDVSGDNSIIKNNTVPNDENSYRLAGIKETSVFENNTPQPYKIKGELNIGAGSNTQIRALTEIRPNKSYMGICRNGGSSVVNISTIISDSSKNIRVYIIGGTASPTLNFIKHTSGGIGIENSDTSTFTTNWELIELDKIQ